MKRKYQLLIIAIFLLNILFFSQKVFGASENVRVNLSVGDYCGNGNVAGAEECDDGNTDNGDGCSSTCKNEEEEQEQESGIIPGIFDPIEIYNISVQPGINEANINWNTNKDAYCRLDFGDDEELSLGVLEGMEKKRNHNSYLTDLEANHSYYFQIECHDSWGHQKITQINSFRTKEEADIIPPANVADLVLKILADNSIELSWTNPDEEDFQGVKILKSEFFYPNSLKDGEEIYNGREEYFIDKNVILGKRYYYTVFSYDELGNSSAGATASVLIAVVPGGGEGAGEEEFEPLPETGEAPIEEQIEISPDDFDFFIANGTIQISPDDLNVLPGTVTAVETESKKYPEVLKSIFLTLTPKGLPEAEKESAAKNYLLKINEEKGVYETGFISPLTSSDYDMYLTFINFQNLKIAKTKTILEIKKFGRILTEALTPGATEVKAAEITLYREENGNFEKWQASEYSQFNPLYSNDRGQYGFLAPPGKYLIKVSKSGFYDYESLPFEIDNYLVREDIDLIRRPVIIFPAYIYLALILIMAYIAYKRVKMKE